MMKATLNDIQTLVCLQLGRHDISPDQRFIEDLGAESADLVNIIAAAEDKFQASFNEADIPGIHTTRELYDLVIRSM